VLRFIPAETARDRFQPLFGSTFTINPLLTFKMVAQAQASSSRTAPSADSLAFSANIFTSQIDSWIPANFGTSYNPPSEINNVADQDGNLGIGHPSLELPKHKRQDHGAGQLEKMLGLNKKGKGKAEEGGSTLKKEEEDEEEEASRGSIGKKRKFGTVDLLAGKKKAKAKMKAKPLDVSSSPSTSTTKTQVDENQGTTPSITKKGVDHAETTTPSTRQDTPSSTPIPTSSTASPNTTLTKNQRKNLRKKQKKAAASGAQD